MVKLACLLITLEWKNLTDITLTKVVKTMRPEMGERSHLIGWPERDTHHFCGLLLEVHSQVMRQHHVL